MTTSRIADPPVGFQNRQQKRNIPSGHPKEEKELEKLERISAGRSRPQRPPYSPGTLTRTNKEAKPR